MKLKSRILRLAVTAAAALLGVVAGSLSRSFVISKRNHTATFPAALDSKAHLGKSRLVSGRVLASGTDFAEAADLVVSGDWLLILAMVNRLTALNLRDATIKDFSAVFSTLPSKRDFRVPYSMMWGGRTPSEVFVGNNFQMFSRLLVTSDGVKSGSTTSSFSRPTDVFYSLPLAEEQWVSNGLLRDETTLVFGKMVGGRFLANLSLKKPVFPGISQTFVSQEANRNVIAASPDGKRIAQVFWFAPVVNIYDDAGTLLHSVAGPVGVTQAFGERMVHSDVRMRHFPETTYCYLSVAATRKGVIALFSGMTRRDSRFVQGSQLHVFNWDGDLIEVVNLDSPVAKIATRAEAGVLWGIRLRPSAAVLEYQMP
jgi:hypothetical protein